MFMNSGLLTLNLKDLLKGVGITIATTVLAGIVPVLQSGALPNLITLKGMVIAGVSAGIAYLGKNLLTNSQGQFLTKETPDVAAK
jgi:hypothetical protein